MIKAGVVRATYGSHVFVVIFGSELAPEPGGSLSVVSA